MMHDVSECNKKLTQGWLCTWIILSFNTMMRSSPAYSRKKENVAFNLNENVKLSFWFKFFSQAVLVQIIIAINSL